jgi:hypothetical protein
VVAEERAVEAELARSRAYWQQMGNFNYALSRISYSKLCAGAFCFGNHKDTDAAQVLQAYFNELNNIKTFSYPDESANYTITTTVTAAADDTPGRQTYSGYLMAQSDYTTSSLVASSSGKLPNMELRLCTGVDSDKECGNIVDNNGGNWTQYFSINRLTNLPSL